MITYSIIQKPQLESVRRLRNIIKVEEMIEK